MDVSIHAPHAGRDEKDGSPATYRRGFNPRAPCGARQGSHKMVAVLQVSIHAPHAGRDVNLAYVIAHVHSFNPRAPCGARPPPARLRPPCPGFNPRAPCGARRYRPNIDESMLVFQSTRPMRGATRSSPPSTPA